MFFICLSQIVFGQYVVIYYNIIFTYMPTSTKTVSNFSTLKIHKWGGNVCFGSVLFLSIQKVLTQRNKERSTVGADLCGRCFGSLVAA